MTSRDRNLALLNSRYRGETNPYVGPLHSRFFNIHSWFAMLRVMHARNIFQGLNPNSTTQARKGNKLAHKLARMTPRQRATYLAANS